MKRFTIFILLLVYWPEAHAQDKLFTKAGSVYFFSKAPLESIEARNNKLFSVWTPNDGKIEFSLLVKGFEFKKALMQEHFNDDYMQSDLYPKATFKGIVEISGTVSFTQDKIHKVNVSGVLTLHGISKQIIVPAIITVTKNSISAVANFSILLADYNIKIPKIVAGNIAKQVDIVVTIPAYQKL